MVDCFDRIAVQMTELALEPVRLLGQRTMLASVSLRTPSSGRLYEITIAKRFPEASREGSRVASSEELVGQRQHGVKPGYIWDAREIDREGTPIDSGAYRQSTAGAVHADPEDAYWAAVNGVCQLSKDPSGRTQPAS